jgi:hypothetical protein
MDDVHGCTSVAGAGCAGATACVEPQGRVYGESRIAIDRLLLDLSGLLINPGIA